MVIPTAASAKGANRLHFGSRRQEITGVASWERRLGAHAQAQRQKPGERRGRCPAF